MGTFKQWRMRLSRIVIAMLAVTLISSGLLPVLPVQASEAVTAPATRTVTVRQAVNEAAAWIVDQGPVTDDWYAYSIAKAGKTVESGYLTSAEQRAQAFTSDTLPTAYAKLVLGVKAAGGDPQSIAGRNLIEAIYNRADLPAQGANAVIYGLLALDSGNYMIPSDAAWTKDKLVKWLLQKQIPNQGWDLYESTKANVDITAAALWALAPYKDRTDVAAAVNDAVAWLAAQQQSNGDLTADRSNSNSLAMVVLGLSSQLKDGTQGSFAKADGNLISALMKYASGDGGFSYKAGSGSSDGFSTYQALLALAAYDTMAGGSGQTYEVPVSSGSTNGKAKVFIHVETKDGTLAEGYETAKTPLEALQQVAARSNLPVVTKETPFFDVYSIGSVAKTSTSGNYPYWGFNIKRNGAWTGDWDWRNVQLQPGDEVAVFFGPYGASAMLDTIELTPASPKNHEPFQVKVTQFNGTSSVPAAVYVQIGGQRIWTDSEGVAYFPNGYSETDQRIEVTGALEGGYPSVIRGVKELPPTVTVHVEGPSSTISSTQVRGGNVFQALQNAVTNVVYTEGQYFGVQAVDGITASGYNWWGFAVERAGGWIPTDGWLTTPLQQNDEVLVYYSGMDTQLVNQITVTPSAPKAGQSFTIQVEQKDWQGVTKASGVQVRVGEAAVTTDSNGMAYFSGLPAGTHELVITGYRANEPPKLVKWSSSLKVAQIIDEPPGPGTEEPTVAVSVEGDEDRGTILSTSSISWKSGDTPYSVIVRALGADRVESSGSGSNIYVKGIDGLREFDHGPKSGWLYAVNCSFPSTSAGAYVLSRNDRVFWRYTVNGGDDVKAEPLPGCSASSTGSGSGGIPSADAAAELDKELSQLSIRYNHKSAVNAQQQTVVVKNTDQRMSPEAAAQLRQQLASNQVQLQQLVTADQTATLADAKEEVKLLVPASALKEQKTITVQEQASSSRPEVLTSVFEFGPNGTVFEKPVYISIKVPLTGDRLGSLAMVWWKEDTKEWIPIPAVVDAKTGVVTGAVDHFTKFAVIDKTKLAAPEAPKASPEVSKALQAVVQYVLKHNDVSDWEAYGLAAAGAEIPASYLASVESRLREKEGKFREVTDYERIALGVMAAGGNPREIAGYDLIQSIVNNERMTVQGTNGPIFALTVLGSGRYEVSADSLWTESKLLQWLLQRQNSDGGWPLAEDDDSEIDITAMAVASLAPYRTQEGVKPAIDKALVWLSKQQQADGGFGEVGQANSESAAQVLVALSALGIPATDERFVKSGASVLSHLLSYQLADGSFAHEKGKDSSEMATEQALLALAKYQSLNGLTVSNSPSVSTPAFADGQDISAWAAGYVESAVKHGLMNGMDGNRFAPREALTRAQFVAVLLRLKGVQPSAASGASFEDVPQDSWYSGYVAEASRQGLVNGVDERNFAPDRSITRQEMALVIDRAFSLSSTEAGTSPFTDLGEASASAIPSIHAVYAKGYMEGDEYGRFLPQASVTREMAAAVMVRAYEKQK
ncbi:S-layer homology domain-containing protein [Paenibacillus chartarius]|uniref:S-layer homology domain-containing protein n=1 Tax=Paenibacillus chartarius TaxID=747481 RepID=A0ABV6DFZ0_9BACL